MNDTIWTRTDRCEVTIPKTVLLHIGLATTTTERLLQSDNLPDV